MFAEFDLSKLSSLPLAQRNSLPECPAIYFAIDSKNRVLYLGKAVNLLARWKNHHRQEQLNRINRKTLVKIAWLTCPNELQILASTETYFIDFYQPLLNQTPVPAKKITPSELVLRQALYKLVGLDVVVFGYKAAVDSFLPTVYLKYSIEIWREEFISNTGLVNNIIQANNKRKATGLKWRKYEKRKFAQAKVRSWKTSCNGVNIELSPWRVNKVTYMLFQPKIGENTVIQTLAGVEMPTLKNQNWQTF